ncbi:hypothetical protein [Aliidiomarina indica]|uniref:hypothetical protein n=1 Tax=Aliidiomarina indica TaxID=2749147 RepID=UPI00188E58F4|nr:hypothetical protein [Aliidiomarina indica]
MNTLVKRTLWFALCLPLFLAGCASQPAHYQVSSGPTIAPDPMSLDDYCLEHPCRGETDISLATIDGGYHYSSDYYWPVVDKDQDIYVLAGERLFVEIEFDEFGSVKSLRHVNEIQHPERTMEYHFRQVAGNYGMLATLRNPLNQPIKFTVTLIDIDGNKVHTGTCPIRARRSFMDQWKFPAKAMILSDLQILPADAPIICTG